MTVQAVTRTAGWEAPVRERDWSSGAGSDFTLYLAGLLHRPGLTQFAGRQELSGPDDLAGQQVRETRPEAAGVDRTPPAVKSRRQGEIQAAAVKQEEARAGQQGAKEAAGAPYAAGEPGAATGKAAAAAARAVNSHRNNMPAGAGAPPEAANPLGQGKPHTLLPGQKTAGLDAVTGRLTATAGTATQGKKLAAVVAGEGPMVLTTATIPGAGGDEVILTPEGVLMARGVGLPGYGLKPGTPSSLKVAGSKGGFQQGVPEGQGQAKNGGKLFPQESGEQAGIRGAREDVFPVREGALTRTAAGSSQAELTTINNIHSSTGPGPGRNHTGGQRGNETAGWPGITGNDSLVAGQGSFPALFPGTGQQSGGVVLPVSNLPEVMATIMASARMSRSGSQQELEIQLQPESLGNMKLRATLDGGRLALHLLVENSEAARALQAAVPEMRQAVAGQGLRLDQVQVQVAGGGHGSNYQTGSRGEHRQGPGWQPGAPAWTAHDEETVTFGTWYRLDYLA
ncbi:Flagellar hook-length control protein FliK [Neomoorella glycerini]|uniref:Flagellar hook-length control protein FliK n=1 Tax=Neomoorella glycerini TaxID=55779 RepID=A0A6I5ZS65_9FIRM|nr:flagellar hook-length control protein FliK [Moorella glycerini]QGP92842.1 Flagellar hook-length control protein FliK [Moorella glycerini]